MSALTPTVDAWTPPPDGTEWMRDPSARANYLAALCHHNEHVYAECVAWLAMWRAEIADEPDQWLTADRDFQRSA